VTTNNPRRPAIVLALAVVWLLFALPAQLQPTHFVHDDSYFYLQIANNIVDGHGSTFHEITPTNGYHPLWMVVCVTAMAVAGGNKALALHFVVMIQAVLFIGVAFFFRRITILLGLRFSVVGIALLAGFLLSTALYGSEAHLNAFTLALGLYLMLAALSRPPGSMVWAGIVFGMSILARLDNVFVVGALIGCAVLTSRIRDTRALSRRVIALGGPVLVIVGSYLLFNRAAFGHFMPISGAIKSTFPALTGDPDNLGRLGKLVSVFAVVSLVLAFVRWRQPLPRVALGGLGAGVLAHAAYVVLFTDHYTFWSWYYVAGVLNVALLAVLVTDAAVARASKTALRRAFGAAAVLLAVVLTVAGLGYGWAKALNPTHVGPLALPGKPTACRWAEQLGVWMKRNLPERSGVLVYDWPGALAFHSDLRILPADGLINDFDYNRELPAMGAAEYLCHNDVGYYFGRRVSMPGLVGPQRELVAREAGNDWHELEIYTPLTHEPAGTIRISDKNLVIRVKEIVDCPEETPDVAIWRIEGDCVR
jgi:hypothetical protein